MSYDVRGTVCPPGLLMVEAEVVALERDLAIARRADEIMTRAEPLFHDAPTAKAEFEAILQGRANAVIEAALTRFVESIAKRCANGEGR